MSQNLIQFVPQSSAFSKKKKEKKKKGKMTSGFLPDRSTAVLVPVHTGTSLAVKCNKNLF
jgi:hypothetical protein